MTKKETGTFINGRGQRLHTVQFEAVGSPKALLIFHHGYGEHTGRYDYGKPKGYTTDLAFHTPPDCRHACCSLPGEPGRFFKKTRPLAVRLWSRLLQSSRGWPRQALQCTHMTAMAMGAQSQRRSAAEHSSGASTMWWGSKHASLCISIVLHMRWFTVCDILYCPKLYMLQSHRR